jgi:hypothetical protein
MDPQLVDIVNKSIQALRIAESEIHSDSNGDDIKESDRSLYPTMIREYLKIFTEGTVREQKKIREDHIWDSFMGMAISMHYPESLLVAHMDMTVPFTEVVKPDFNDNVYRWQIENAWHHWLAMSFWGGKEALGYLDEEIKKVGFIEFCPERGPEGDEHWYVAYQEILLEAIYLARAKDNGYKQKILREAQGLKSTHVQRLAKAMFENPIDMPGFHSLGRHKIWLLYNKVRSLKPRVYDYTQGVLVDKVQLLGLG